MCTLTIVPLAGGRLRVGFNRDERRTRPTGTPPEIHTRDGRNAIYPTDPESGGTWLAVNDVGLILALLNATPPSSPPFRGRRSRGEIIPALLNADTPADSLAKFDPLFRFADFPPFRLVLVGQGVVADMRWDGQEPMVVNRLLGNVPLLFTSSGLGDHLVEGVRRELFDAMFAANPSEWPAVQDAFHRHRWPGREHLSIDMSRDDARTVSRAVIELDDDTATFRYADTADAGGESVATLPFQFAGAR